MPTYLPPIEPNRTGTLNTPPSGYPGSTVSAEYLWAGVVILFVLVFLAPWRLLRRPDRKAKQEQPVEKASKLDLYGGAEELKSYHNTAERGNAKGQLRLGFAYANGLGVPKDEALAYKWYLLAAAQGDPEARENFTTLERHLTPSQREEGQRLAREFKPVPE